MIVSTIITSITAMISPSMGWSIAMPTGVPSEATPTPTVRQGGELGGLGPSGR